MVKIDPAIQEWIPPLDPDSYAKLEASILDEGCRDALIVWGNILVDGHHRHAICRSHGKPFKVSRIDFADRDHAEVWVRTNQAARRNLTDDQRAANADLLAEAEERISKAKKSKHGRRYGKDQSSRPQRSRTREPRQRAAKASRISERRVRRMRAIRKADAELAKQIQAGTLTIRDAERLLRARDRDTKRTAAADAAKIAVVDDTCGVEHRDFRSIDLAANSVALLFTDPPYHDRTIDLYTDVGRVAAHVLKDGGSLITYIAHHRMPETIAMLQAAGLTFFWPLAVVYTSGNLARMTEYGIIVHYKPLLWFVKGTFRSRDDLRFVHDVVESPKPEKTHHPWQQDIGTARYYIETLTQPGDLVFDPFCGGGTTALAAKQTARRWLTCDTDEQSVWIARQRVREAAA